MKIAVDVKGLGVSFQGRVVVQDVSFSVHQREFLVFVGPNGAGKSTLLRALLGLVPYKGDISWVAQNISYVPPQERVSHKNVPPLSVQDFFMLKNVAQENMLESIDAVGLSKNILSQQFTRLSTGQFQRMLIAWAIASKPDVLVCDEPTTGIDIEGQQKIYCLLNKLREDLNLTVISVLHDLHMVTEHADRVICLNKKIICSGSPQKILTPNVIQKLYGETVHEYKH